MSAAAACIWITGGGSGVGAALARRLAESGEQVVITGRQEDDLTRVAAGQPGILPFPIDIADSSAVRNGVQRIERDIAPISLAVLTTGNGTPTPLSAFERERLRGQVDAGVGGALNCLGALVPILRQRGCGHVAILPPAGKGSGVPLATLVESLSHDLADTGIKIQVIDPAMIRAIGNDIAAVEEILRGLRSDRVTVSAPPEQQPTLWRRFLGLFTRK